MTTWSNPGIRRRSRCWEPPCKVERSSPSVPTPQRSSSIAVLSPVAADVDRLVADLNVVEVVERLVAEDADRGAGGEAEGLPAAEAGRVVVLGFADDDLLAHLEVIERQEIAALHFALG